MAWARISITPNSETFWLGLGCASPAQRVSHSSGTGFVGQGRIPQQQRERQLDRAVTCPSQPSPTVLCAGSQLQLGQRQEQCDALLLTGMSPLSWAWKRRNFPINGSISEFLLPTVGGGLVYSHVWRASRGLVGSYGLFLKPAFPVSWAIGTLL